MVRYELAREIAKKAGLSMRQAENLVIAFGATITDTLSKGEKIVYSNFGTFYTVHYPSKIITHPKLGSAKKIVMLPTNVAKWMPAENIKAMVNHGKIKESATVHGRKHQKTDNNQPAIENDEIVIPVRHHSTKQTENIYEKLMEDGKEEMADADNTSPSNEDKSIWKKIFSSETKHQKTAESNSDQKVTLLDSGFFNKDNAAATLPSQPADQPSPTPQAEPPKEPENELKPLEPTVSAISPDIIYVDLSKTIVPKEVLQQVPEKIARRYMMVPIENRDDELVIAMTDPEDIEAKEIIKKLVQKKIAARLATESDVNHILDQYQGFESEVQEAIETVETSDENKLSETEKQKLIDAASEDAPAARIVSSLLRRAIRDKASDIHIEAAEDEVQVRFRMDGILRKKINYPKDVHPAVVSRIKILCNLKIDEQRLPQDGRFSINIDNRRVDFRVSTLPTAYGEKIVMRILDKMTGILTVEQLGLAGSGLKNLEANLAKSHGMILVTGPTGSGKTTTLYALISRLFAEGVNIVTLEDPIEYQVPGINQSQVNTEINYTFASGLRSLVRQDPDIIMIGEIRDGETAEMAVQSALTGHVVLSTLHTNDAAGAAPRLIDMGVEPFLLTSSINLVIGQRLARKLCDECKEEKAISGAEAETVKAVIDKMPKAEKESFAGKKLKFLHGKGCKTCGDTGYRGRLGIYEVLSITETIKDMVLRKVSSSQIQDEAVNNGMVTMIQDGIIKASQGLTSLEEVWRVTKD